MDQPLCDTALTGSKLESLLSTSPKMHLNGHKLQTVSATPIGDGQGFTSKVLRVQLTWSDSDSKISNPLPKSIIVKIMGNTAVTEMFDSIADDQAKKMNDNLNLVHDVECTFYEYEELRDFLFLPICYYKIRNSAEGPGIIILEDLGDRAVPMHPKLIGFGVSKIQLDDMLDAITSLHAWSASTSIDWRKKSPKFIDFGIFRNIQTQLIDMYPKTKEQYPRSFENLNEEKFRQFLTYEKFAEIFGCDPVVKYNLPWVLVHGDMHFMNMLFEKKDNGEYGDRLVSMIDYQFTHQGCGMEDVARLVAMSISIEKKKQWTDYILEKYVELFNQKVTKPESLITLSNTKRAFDDFFAYTATMWGICFTMIDQFSKQIKNINEEERIALRDRIIGNNDDNFQDARKIFNF